jgi:hypothetical protein
VDKKKDYIEFIGSMLIFGTNGLLVTHIQLTSAQIVLTRTFLGSLFLLAVVLAKKELNLRQFKGDVLPVLISGICLGANWVFLFEAYKYASVSIGTLGVLLRPHRGHGALAHCLQGKAHLEQARGRGGGDRRHGVHHRRRRGGGELRAGHTVRCRSGTAVCHAHHLQ